MRKTAGIRTSNMTNSFSSSSAARPKEDMRYGRDCDQALPDQRMGVEFAFDEIAHRTTLERTAKDLGRVSNAGAMRTTCSSSSIAAVAPYVRSFSTFTTSLRIANGSPT